MILMTVIAAGWAAVAYRAWELGIVDSLKLKALAKDQYTRRITMSARRGMITDRHGEELAVEVEIDSVYADPRKVKDPATATASLVGLIGGDEASLRSKLASKRHFVWLKRRVKPATAESIGSLRLKGIDLIKESKRYYPGRKLAANVLGFAGVDSVGLEGVELEFDELLRGRADSVEGLKDARGRVVFSEGMFGPKGVVGNTVELTLDRTLQYIAEQELEATIRTFEAKSGHVVVMDPKTGEILAMANWPTFNPNSIRNTGPEQHRNRAVLDVFEPGSTLKIFTLAAALNSGAVRPNDLIYCEQGRMEMYDMVIHDDHRDGWLNLTQCLKRSSNVCLAKIAMKLGKERLYHYFRRFGFGEATHVDAPFESSGVVHHFSKWYDIDTAMISFGQGVGVTGLQLASAVSAIANQGVLMRPLLVKRIVGPGPRR